MKTIKRTPRNTKRVFKIQQHCKQNVEISVESPFGFFIKEAASVNNYRDLNKVIGVKGLRYKSVRPLMQHSTWRRYTHGFTVDSLWS